MQVCIFLASFARRNKKTGVRTPPTWAIDRLAEVPWGKEGPVIFSPLVILPWRRTSACLWVLRTPIFILDFCCVALSLLGHISFNHGRDVALAFVQIRHGLGST